MDETTDLAAALEAARRQLEAVRTQVKDRLKLARSVQRDAEASVVDLRIELASGTTPGGRPMTEAQRAHLQDQLESRRRLLSRSDARVDELERLERVLAAAPPVEQTQGYRAVREALTAAEDQRDRFGRALRLADPERYAELTGGRAPFEWQGPRNG